MYTLVIFVVRQKEIFITEKTLRKKSFSQKNFPLSVNFKNVVKQKFNKEKIKIKGLAFISKKNYLNLFQFLILISVSSCSLYLVQTSP